MLIHLRVIPDFWTMVEERDRPELAARPVIIGGLPNERGLVREANMHARYCGIQPGMTLSQAYQQAPDGIFLNPDLARYQTVWDGVVAILQTFTPKVEPVEMGQAFLDIGRESGRPADVCNTSLPKSNVQLVWTEAIQIASQVQTETGINPWMGIAVNRITAQLASTQGSITLIEPGREKDFLADLPLTLLPELDPRTASTFQVLGLKTIGQLAALPAAAVRQRFGVLGERLHSYARGIDPRPVVPPPTAPAIAVRRDCEEGSLEEAVAVVHRLAMDCAVELEKSNLAGRLIALTLIPESKHSISRKRTHCLAQTSQTTDEAEPISWSQNGKKSVCEPRVEVCETDACNTSLQTQNSKLTTKDSNLALPVPYRIHSMLPQPKPSMAGTLRPVPTPSSIDVPIVSRASTTFIPSPQPTPKKLTTVVRTPIREAFELFACARKLLIAAWQGLENAHLGAIELEIAQFERPAQLAFAELNRLDQTGRLAGLDPGRLQAIVRQEEVLTARYGDDPFRHIAALDPTGTLTERRFKWGKGIPWRRPS